MSRSRRWRWRRSRRRKSCGGSRRRSRSLPSGGRRSAALRSRRPPRPPHGPPPVLLSASCTPRRCPPGPERASRSSHPELASECDWLIAHEVLPADVVTRNRRLAEAALRPWTPVFTHGDLHIEHVFVDGDELTGILDWSEAAQGDALYDLATLTLGHEEHLDDVLAGYGTDVDRGLIRAWWSFRCLVGDPLAVRKRLRPILARLRVRRAEIPGCEAAPARRLRVPPCRIQRAIG